MRSANSINFHPRHQRATGVWPNYQSLTGLLAVLVIVAVGCATPPPTPPPLAPPIAGYIVGAPDLLLVSILPEPEITREVRVRPDGKISIDLIGDVQAAGRTPVEIGADI